MPDDPALAQNQSVFVQCRRRQEADIGGQHLIRQPVGRQRLQALLRLDVVEPASRVCDTSSGLKHDAYNKILLNYQCDPPHAPR